MNETQLLIWEPSIYKSTLECYGCNQNIAPKSPFFISAAEVRWLLPHDSSYQPYSVRCAACGLLEFMHNNFNRMFKDAIWHYDPTVHNGDGSSTFLSSMRQLVRDELKQILKEEAFDPNGPFSPAP